MIKTVIITACNNYNSNNDNNNSRDRSNLNGTKNGQTEICIEVQVLLTEKKILMIIIKVCQNNEKNSRQGRPRFRWIRPLEARAVKDNLLCLLW